MKPTIGRIVLYTLSETDCAQINRRRTTSSSIATRIENSAHPPSEQSPIGTWPSGAQAHIGNDAHPSQVVPLVVVQVWPNEYGLNFDGVNGQAILDGNDTLWVTSAREGTEPGTWHWPTRE